MVLFFAGRMLNGEGQGGMEKSRRETCSVMEIVGVKSLIRNCERIAV